MNRKFQIRIIRNTWFKKAWWNDEIGNVYWVIGTTIDGYQVDKKDEGGVFHYHIKKDDCIVITREEKLERILNEEI